MATAAISYFKRYKMEVDLPGLPPPVLPPGFTCLPWREDLILAHAEALFQSFQGEIDSQVFPSLGDILGCRTLMIEISRKWGFIPGSTWLLTGPGGSLCGSVQGLRERAGVGAIQNLGIVPPCRGEGLGRALLLQALHGFRAAGLMRAMLEVTAENEPAVNLYRRLGFRRRKILYKAVPDPRADLPLFFL
jgi:ribosomal protein S18 acetylase RimI-like enzyme